MTFLPAGWSDGFVAFQRQNEKPKNVASGNVQDSGFVSRSQSVSMSSTRSSRLSSAKSDNNSTTASAYDKGQCFVDTNV